MIVSKFQKAVHGLLVSEPYYAHFILNSRIMFDAYNVPTAGAVVVSGTPLLIFNTEFMDKQTPMGYRAILKHEILHLLFDHTTTNKSPNPDEHFIHNLATDCIINQYISDLPEGCFTLKTAEELVGYALEPFQTSEYYYDHLIKKAEEIRKSGAHTLDEHDIDVPGKETGAWAMAAAKRVARKAANAAAGNVPDHVLKQIGSDGDSELPWKQILRNFVLRRVSQTSISTNKKMNRRYALPIPGKKKKRTLTLGVCTDSSGSVSDEQYASFLTEVKSIAKQVTKTFLVHADCVVQDVEELTPKTKVEMVRKGGGGTAYQPAITKCLEIGCDVIIYFGDFDCADVPENPKVPFLWVGVGNQEPPAGFGKVLRLKG